MTHARPPMLALLLLLLASLLAVASPTSATDALQPKPTRVLVLRGGDPASDTAAIAALTERGFTVVSGPETPAFDNAQNTLKDVDIVVVLYNANWNTPLQPAGALALERFVRQGGGLVAGEWALWRSQLASIMPALHCGWNVAPSTSYTLVTPNASVNAGLPDSFNFNLANFSGSESCLEPREDATVLYGSSNGGGRAGAGLVAWNVQQGRVAAFSTLLSATELQNASYRTLFQNTVSWMARIRDTTPPRVRSLAVSGNGSFVAERTVSVSFEASDAGGSGLGAYLVREFRFSGDPSAGWTEVASSGWQAFQQAGTSFTWTLDPQPGIHYLQLFVADRAGNVSRKPARAAVNYRPATVPIALDGLHIYRISPGNNTPTFVRMDALSGNPDLYVFGPGINFTPESDGPIEQTNFLAANGVYQIEVAGHQAGSYSLNVVVNTPNLTAPAPVAPSPERRPRISVTAIDPPEPEESAADLPAPPSEDAPAAALQTVYLPLVRQ